MYLISKKLARDLRKFYRAFPGSVGPRHPSPDRAILQGAPCVPTAPPRRSCNGAAQARLRPKGSPSLTQKKQERLFYFSENFRKMSIIPSHPRIVLFYLVQHIFRNGRRFILPCLISRPGLSRPITNIIRQII